ncbi:hypothetical protein TNCV_3196001 [Trichonephila clavipes]|nr:hypothetical protein TNCV_3196001 [Trichonephila clavipes]
MSVLSQPAYFAHANVFDHEGKPVPIELSIATIPRDSRDSEIMCITVNHAGQTSSPKNFDPTAKRMPVFVWYTTRYPRVCPWNTCPFAGKFFHLTQGNRGLIVVKGSYQRITFVKLELFTINLEILPHFRDLNDRTLPDHLHDEVHEDYGISECTMGKSYRFARYLQHFNKLQAERERQTAYLVE